MDLDGRVAIVTGATGGLGPFVTADLTAAGASLGLIGSRLDRLESLATRLGLSPDRWLGQAADLKDPAATTASVDAVISRFGHVDILIHLVGGWTGGTRVTETPIGEFDLMLDQHFRTTLNVTRALVPHLVNGNWGRIVAISSPVASNPPAKMAAYAVGKAAGEALLSTLAREVEGTGTTVNMVLVRTIDVEHAREREPSPKNSRWTTPEEISAAIGYLLSDEAHVVNGARIPLYGGG